MILMKSSIQVNHVSGYIIRLEMYGANILLFFSVYIFSGSKSGLKALSGSFEQVVFLFFR